MRNLTKYALLCGCILALSASCDKNIEPSGPGFEVDESAPISLIAGTIGTKGLLEGDKPLEVSGTTLQIYDYLSGDNVSVNGDGAGYYINNSLTFEGSEDGSSTDGQWQFPSNRKYYWTKTGTHRFFGWLKVDGNGTDLTTADLFGQELEIGTGNVLSIPQTTMDLESPQFDFSYSGIIVREKDHTAVPMDLEHFFTAFAISAKTTTESDITLNSVTVVGLHNKKSATLDFSASATADGDVVAIEPDPTDTEYATPSELPIEFENGLPLTTEAEPLISTDDNFLLMWPQTAADLSDAKIVVNYTVTVAGITTPFEKEVSFAAIKDSQNALVFADGMLREKKYLLTLTVTYDALYVKPTVADWIPVTPLDYELKMSTNMRLFDSWLYRYDTDNTYGSVTPVDPANPKTYDDWAGSHMAVSDGRVSEATEMEPVAGRPLRSPQIQLVTTGAYSFDLVIDNDDFEIVQTVKDTDGKVTGYVASTGDKLNIPAGDDVYTYFYIVPKEGVTPSNPVARVWLIYNDTVTGLQKVTFNNNALPGYSDDSSEIWAYYFAPEDYKIDGKLKMYFNNENNQLVPTSVQN